MGKELKRVPLDFDWPLNCVWKGYFNPYSAQPCGFCKESGYNEATQKLSESWYEHECWSESLTQDEVDMLIEKGRFKDDFPAIEKITAEMINEKTKSRSGGLVHDSLNRFWCTEFRARRLGIYGHCRYCKGEGSYFCDEKYKKLAEDWENIEPPTGEGYQLWETTSEGSPISPVFKSIDELCAYAEKNCHTFAYYKASASEWKKMLVDDFVYHQEGQVIFR